MSCEWMTVSEFADHLKVTNKYVYHLIREGHLEALAMPGTGRRKVIRICKRQLDRFMVNRPVQIEFGAPGRTDQPSPYREC